VSVSIQRRRTTPIIAEEIRRELDAADIDFRSGVQHAIRAGELLLEVKQRVVHGQWLPWVAENVPLSARHAQRLMQLAANATSVAHLETINEAVAVLAEPKALPAPQPDGAIEDVDSPLASADGLDVPESPGIPPAAEEFFGRPVGENLLGETVYDGRWQPEPERG
jgi:hypothetical protein